MYVTLCAFVYPVTLVLDLDICSQKDFQSLGCLLECVLAVPASSSSVERVFSKI